LGNIYAQKTRFAEAADAFQKASQLTPQDAELWRLADKYSRMKEPTKSQEATNASPVQQASPEVPSPDGSDSSARYRELVMGTLEAFQRHDMNAIVARYAEKVVYRDYGVVDQAYIRKDLERYFTRWPVTETQLKGLIRVFDTKKTDEKRVLFS